MQVAAKQSYRETICVQEQVQFVQGSKADMFTLCSDWEPGSLHVFHTREGAVRRRSPEAGGAATPLVQHGDDAGAARDAGEHQRGDPTTGGSRCRC